MGYLFLLVALLAGATKGYCGKKTSGYLSEYKDAMFINFIRMLFCLIIGFTVMIFNGNISSLAVDTQTLLITLCSGVTTSIFVVTWLISVKHGAYMMLDVFLMLDVCIPIIGGKILYNEPIKATQIIGLIILTVAVFIMCSYNNSIKKKINITSFILLLLCGIANGFTDFSQKMFVNSSPNASIAVFNFYTYLFSAVTLLIFYIIFRNSNTSTEKKSEGKILGKIIGYVAVMSVCLYINSFFKTKAAIYIPSVQLYPLNQGTALILSTFMSAVLFKEKLTVKCIIGIITSFIALIIINVL